LAHLGAGSVGENGDRISADLHRSRWQDGGVFAISKALMGALRGNETASEPATVIGWHRRGFARFWTMKSTPIGRPPISAELIALIERMAAENPLWSQRRIAGELAKLGVDVSKDTVAKYMPKRYGRPGRPPSTSWAAFLRAHVAGTLAIDFLTVPTVSFNVLYVFFVLSLERRRVLHVNVTAHPHAAWAAQQMVLLRLVKLHARYYNEDRPHMSLAGDAPAARAVEPIGSGRAIALPRVAGLHHRYSRTA
jgi:hypothetical protein